MAGHSHQRRADVIHVPLYSKIKCSNRHQSKTKYRKTRLPCDCQRRSRVIEVGVRIRRSTGSMKHVPKARTPLFDLDLLKAIVMVADCGTFTAASARLHSTQSTVSQKVRRLEEMAGHKLLERGSRDVRPTDAGETLLAYARRMLALNDEMIEALSGATVGLTVRLGVPEDFVGGPTTHMLAAFNRKHPQVKLEVTSGLSRDLSSSY